MTFRTTIKRHRASRAEPGCAAPLPRRDWLSALAHMGGGALRPAGAPEIFKKTPCIAGLKPAGRDVAQDAPEIDVIALLIETLPDCRNLHDGRSPSSRMTKETTTTVTSIPDQDVMRSADRPITAMGGLVGVAGIPVGAAADDRFFNVKLTDEEFAVRKSGWASCATNLSSGALWDNARQVGAAIAAATIRPDVAFEKQCYADI